MQGFMDQDFLLQTDFAQRLYHGTAEKQPIVDYHSHLSARDIASDRHYSNLAEAWLDSDAYKARLMRAGGVDERFITGRGTTPRERFQKFVEVLGKAIGSPVYAWTHMELQRFFGFYEALTPDTAEEVWELAGSKLSTPDMGVRGLLKKAGVKLICTTEDIAANLKPHEQMAGEQAPFRVVPSLRLDEVLRIEDPQWENYMKYELGQAAGMEEPSTMREVREMLKKRINYFDSLGCRTADHVLDYLFYAPAEEYELDDIVGRIINGRGEPTKLQAEQYKTAVLMTLAKEYAKRGWVMQIRFAAIRNANRGMAELHGSDAGFDCISDVNCADALVQLLNALSQRVALPRMIVYSLNPAAQPVLASILGAFQGAEVPGQLQIGTTCWFNDNRQGLEAQLRTVGSLSVLGTAVGMLADAHNPFSLVRHEYYRRILCNYIGKQVVRGEYPIDIKTLHELVADICCHNAERYFGFED